MDLVQILVTVVIFGALIGTIASQIAGAQANGNVSGAAGVLIGLGTLFLGIGFLYTVGKAAGVKIKGR